MFRFSFTLLLAGLMLAGCDQKTDGIRVETIDGVEIIHNPATPYTNTKLELVEELVLGSSEDEADPVLFQPSAFAVSPEGALYIGDNADNAIKIFDAAGTFIKKFGSRGGGPGEFQDIGTLAFTPDGRLIVADPMAQRVSLFSDDGTFLDSFSITFWPSRILMATDSLVAFTFSTFGKDQERLLAIFRTTFSGTKKDTLTGFTPVKLQVHHEKGMSVGYSIPNAPRSILTADRDKHWFYHCLNSSYSIDVLDSSGTVIRRIQRPYQLQPYTDAEKEKFRERAKKQQNDIAKKLILSMDLPDFKTVTERMLVDDQHRLWVQTNETRGEEQAKETAWDIFDSSGRYQARVWLAVTPQDIIGDKLYARRFDEGVVSIMRFGMRWSED